MKRYVILMILLSLMTPAAMAATVTISPTKINPGDTVTVDVKDIPDNAKFSLSINAEFNANPGEGFNFEACDLTLPFSLKGASMNVYAEGVNEAAVSLEQKGKSYGALNYDDGDNIVKISQSPGDINDGIYDRFTLEGKAAAKSVITKMTVTGKKRGPNSGKITFTFEGDGSITPTIDVSIDESGKSETSSSSTGSPGGPSGPGDSAPPSDTPATTSADGKASLTGTSIEGAKILSSAVEGTLPTGWTTDGRTYSITPADRALDAVISFPAPNTTATIARLEDGAWSLIPSKIEGDRITAKVTRGGSYAVLVLAEVPTQMVTTPTTTAPATTPAATPLAPLIPVAACAILILVQGRKD
ncbi:MAG: hypothetical protein HQQ74_07850 [Methanoculleus bourgensis]|uniref:Uncharacterized protein n=1 Tax=Methanoculleus bourgensis TaxID=83986 RepID=A0A8T7H7E5_9EURY|nr:hypothetical protein [Methanoculleus bourgensis]